MKQLELENITLTLTEEGNAVRVTGAGRNVILAEQRVDEVARIIETNFGVVVAFYLERIAGSAAAGAVFAAEDIHQVCVSIVLSYLYIHNHWRLQYAAKKYQDLGFWPEDFGHPSTHDIIFSYYKNNYPSEWEMKCAVLMDMELDALKAYYERRLQYYNK